MTECVGVEVVREIRYEFFDNSLYTTLNRNLKRKKKRSRKIEKTIEKVTKKSKERRSSNYRSENLDR